MGFGIQVENKDTCITKLIRVKVNYNHRGGSSLIHVGARDLGESGDMFQNILNGL